MIKLYNTYTRSIEDFKPLNPDLVTFYSCGPTVYDYAHIGNLKKYINDDIFVRVLQFNGYTVKHVTNITDVGHLVSDADAGEDKMTKGLRREGLDFSVESMLKLADIYTTAFKNDLRHLNVLNPDVWPKATEHVAEMIEIVSDLIKKGFVYETSTAFYFDTSKFPNYDKLGHLQKDDQKTGARIELDPEKKNPWDFAVWMKAVGENANHVMVWDAPFSKEKGFPGWHIECSAMSMKYLGQTIDLHSGGIDHIKVHHTNEIAQSEAFTGKQFVRYWLHSEFLVLASGKMAKSDGTFITLQGLIDQGYDPLAYRFLLLQAHYRTPLMFSYESLDSAKNGLDNLRDKILALGDGIGDADHEYTKEFREIVSNDFDTPKGVALVFAVLKDEKLSDADKKATILEFDTVLGLNLAAFKRVTVEIPEEIKELAERRLEAKRQKDFTGADILRQEMLDRGWIIKDGKEGYEIKKI